MKTDAIHKALCDVLLTIDRYLSNFEDIMKALKMRVKRVVATVTAVRCCCTQSDCVRSICTVEGMCQ
jgi:hypothetical protein